MLTPSELDTARRAFFVFDRNSDGIIDIGKLLASLITLGHPHPSEKALQVILDSLDKDRSGGIEFAEFLQVIEQQKAQQVARSRDADTLEAFVAMGGKPDRSGCVSVERLQRTIRAFELTIDLGALLEAMDKLRRQRLADSDGSVSYEEFQALLAGDS